MSSMIDALYAGYVNALPGPLRAAATELPHLLKLAPAPGKSWSDVFSNAVTLEAPRLLAEGLEGARPEQVRTAVLAHGLAVIEAFGQDRIADRQVTSNPLLLELLARFREDRDSLLHDLWPASVAEARAADLETHAAILEERALLSRIAAATFSEYRRISLAKQAIGFPATVALAHAVGAPPERLEQLKRILSGIWLGLQFEDDAGDWEDDWRRGGGAWAVSLARRRLEAVGSDRSEERPTEPDLVRKRVLKMRVLYLMLRDARHQYRTAWRHARVVSAPSIVSWTEQRQARLDNLLPLEDQHAGYVVRAIKLGFWAAEVLT